MSRRVGRAVLTIIAVAIATETVAREFVLEEAQKLGLLAETHAMSITALIRANDSIARVAVRAGNTLILPSGKKHRVRRGETLSGIARKHFVSIEAIVKRNRWLEDVLLPAGLKVTVPKKWPPRAAPFRPSPPMSRTSAKLAEQLRKGEVALVRDMTNGQYVVRDVAVPHTVRGRIAVIDGLRFFYSTDVGRLPQSFSASADVIVAEILADRAPIALADQPLSVRLQRQAGVTATFEVVLAIDRDPRSVDSMLRRPPVRATAPEVFIGRSPAPAPHIPRVPASPSVLHKGGVPAKSAQIARTAATSADDAARILRWLRILPFL